MVVLSVDCHDAFLWAKPGSADHEQLEQIKRYNAAVAAAVAADWDAAGLPTERNYLRRKIRQAKTESPRSKATDGPGQ